ncbi:hypothetical protein SLS60_012085 [Paraconiothyrium brasiliense]|uniref:non-specific serine/threonine protein kinase n=1 Tax=Paraconiothyrium brasiliense TaxID=300254 RepID=A0ABR3QGP8_9PLEO
MSATCRHCCSSGHAEEQYVAFVQCCLEGHRLRCSTCTSKQVKAEVQESDYVTHSESEFEPKIEEREVERTKFAAAWKTKKDAPICLDTRAGPGMTTSSIWYTILQTIGRDDETTRSAFEMNGVSNTWFPIPRQTLRHLLDSRSSELAFIERQEQGLSNSNWPDGSLDQYFHLALEDGDEIMQPNRILGEGAHGLVEEVKLSNGLICVRKRISRPKPFKSQKVLFNAFASELNIMRQAKHHHCVQLLGSYTDYDSVAILSLPVADMDLAAFLDLPSALTPNRERSLRRNMGCLCNALAYLHRNNIRHKDLKPQNVLIHGDNLLLTDFGFSLDFSDETASTTTGRPSAWTVRYAAPEVLNFEARSRATDIYALGCVLIEMISRLYGSRLQDLKMYWKTHGNGHISFALNSDATRAWCTRLTETCTGSLDRYFLALCETLITTNRYLRPTIRQIIEKLSELEAHNLSEELNYFGRCCASAVDNGDIHPKLTGADLSFFYPTIDPAVDFFLLDLDMTVIYSKSQGYLDTDSAQPNEDAMEDTQSPLPTYNPLHLQAACHALRAAAQRGYSPKEFWESWGGLLRDRPHGISHAAQSIKVAPIKCMITVQIRGHPELGDLGLTRPDEPFHVVDTADSRNSLDLLLGHTLQVSRLFICLESKWERDHGQLGCWGVPFYLVSFKPGELPRSGPPQALFNHGNIMDFTRA